ncbi:MAG: DNRLRE domain-containing protein [Candidatus Phytoplasma sp.]|nr:DNRLRE domain-containing protein [Phytoplasma sp.]
MNRFFLKKSKKLVDQAVRTLLKFQKSFAVFGLFLIFTGTFLTPAVSAYQVISPPLQTEENKEELTMTSDEQIPLELHDDLDASMIPVVKEIETLREENQKVFLKQDGTHEVSIYQEPVHFKNGDEYIEIDNTLIEQGKYYTNTKNSFNIYFPKSLTKNEKIKVNKDEYQIEWKILDAKTSKAKKTDKQKKDKDLTVLDHLNSSIKYKNVFSNTDLEYVLKSNQIKENLYLNKYHQNISFMFEYKVKNLSIKKIDEQYCFVNDENEKIFSLDKLYMMDSEDKVSYDIKIEVEHKSKDTYIIKITPDNSFLKEASYPVLIDPTLSLPITTPAIEDTYVSQNYPTSNYSSQTTMQIGYDASGSASRKDILIKFTIPSFISSNEVITYSHLNLFRTDTASSNLSINLYKNTSSFTTSSVTWNTKPSYMNQVIDYYDFQYVYAPLSFDISSLVKDWHENGKNYGLTIAPDSYIHSLKTIYQSQASITVRPVVKIGYETKGGLKNYWTYTSQSLGQAGTGYVSDFTGNLVFKRDEYYVENEYLALNLSFYHNSIDRYQNVGYGYGYKTNYNYKLQLDSNLMQYYLQTPDGNKVYFHLLSTDSLEYPYQWDNSIAEDGSRWELYQEFYQGSLNYATINTPEKIRYEFDNLGRLIYIRDTNTYQSIGITYQSDDKISMLKDYAGNKITFTYSSNLLTQTELQLIQPNGSFKTVEKRVYSYYLTNLSSVMLYIGYDKTTNTLIKHSGLYYSYLSNRLTSAYSDIDNYKVAYTHNSAGKVTNISLTDDNYALSDIKITYEYLKTTQTNQKGEWVRYLFDNYGHTINVLDSNFNATYYRYANPFSYLNINANNNGYNMIDQKPNFYINHKLIESSDVLKQNQNYIANHGFENINGLSPWMTTGNVATDVNHRLLGDKSLKINSQTTTGQASQSILLKKGSYRLTVWVKNDNTNGKSKVSVTSNAITNSVVSQTTLQWEELKIDFTLTSDLMVTIKLENIVLGTISYFDNVELSDGYVDTRYNALTNHSFENDLNNWSYNGATVVTNNQTEAFNEMFGNKQAKIIGNRNENRYISQVITNFLTEGETYMVGAWAKANASPMTVLNGINRRRFFGLEIHISKENDDDSVGVISYYLPFNPNTQDWQYQMTAIQIPYKTFDVTISLRYQGSGEVLFDNVFLYHDNLKTDYKYDQKNGNLLETKNAQGTTSYTYNNNYKMTSITQNNQKLDISYKYNNISQLSMNNVKASYTYTSKNQIKETLLGDQSNQWFKSSVGHTSDFQYINQTTNEFGHQTNYEVNYLTGLIDMVENANKDKTYFTYDSLGNLIKQEEIETITNAKIIKNIVYDEVNRLKSISIDGVTYEFLYDKLDRVTNIKIAGIDYVTLNFLEETYNNKTYQTNKVSYQKYGNNDTYYFTYDNLDNVTKIRLNNKDLYEFSYDKSNRLTIYKDLVVNDIYFYSYDLANRLEQIIDQSGNKINYTYDTLGNINGKNYEFEGINRKVYYVYNQYTGEYEYTYYKVGNNTIKNEYLIDTNDSLRRVNQINLIISTTLNLSTHISYLNPNTSYGNTSMMIDQISYKKNNQTEHIHEFKYDKLGNITEIKITGLQNELYNYTYDGFGRLIKEDIWIPTSSKTIEYTYDTKGNITNTKTYAYKNTSYLLEEKQFIYDDVWKDQLKEVSHYINHQLLEKTTYSYDQIGNPIQILKQNSLQQETLIYEGRRLVSHTIGDITYNYTYNDSGIRTSISYQNKKVEFFLEGNKVLVEKHDQYVIYYTYDINDELLSFNYQGNEYYYLKNILGDITGILNEEGNLVAKYNYDAWGNIIYQYDDGTNISNINPYRYRGYRYDNHTGLYYLNARYYDPTISRFISADSINYLDPSSSAGLNLYAYCDNNPVMYSDSEGTSPKWYNPFSWGNGAKIIAGVVIIAGLAIATVATGGAAGGVAGFILAGALKGATIGAVSGGLISGAIGGLSSGSWEGFYDGFSSGFMTGAFIGGVTGAVSNAIKVGQAASMWDKGTFKSGYSSMKHHYGTRGAGSGNIVNYTNNAVGFASRNANSLSLVPNYSGLQNAWTLNTKFFGSGLNGLYTAAGKIITFGVW